jgi:putative SOS response-associated peptidase YedK
MCGRYSFALEDALILERFGIRVRTAIYKASYNCTPSQNLAVIANDAPDTLKFFRWGLIPYWTKNIAGTGHGPSLLINARAETLVEKPSFKNAFRNRRCLVPATGFYEWEKKGRDMPWHVPTDTPRHVPTPFHFGMKNGDAFCFAGLWDKWVSPDQTVIHSFTIITTGPNELVEPIHNRMPVILHREDELRWIEPNPNPSLIELLKPFPADLMIARPAEKLS